MDILRLSNLVFSPEWDTFLEYLENERANKVSGLVACGSHDLSMSLRGEIRQLDRLIALKKAVQDTRKAKR